MNLHRKQTNHGLDRELFRMNNIISISLSYCILIKTSLTYGRICSILSSAAKFCLAHGLGQLTRDIKCDVRTLNVRNGVIFVPPGKYRMTFGKGRKMSKIKEMTHDIQYFLMSQVRKIIKHRSMQTEKSQLSGQQTMPETR